MPFHDIRTCHQNDLEHHAFQAEAWLGSSANGENTAALSYAALELRYATERLLVHYWATLLNRPLKGSDFDKIKSFQGLQAEIYELGGHQREINAHFEFMRIFFGAIKFDAPVVTPHIGKLTSLWHTCSEVCHIAWVLACTVPELRAETFKALSDGVELVHTLASSLGWPMPKDREFSDLRRRFVAGEATEDDVLAYMKRVGVWAKVEYPDGRPSEFVGEAIPPGS